jgi:hypothetical protein
MTRPSRRGSWRRCSERPRKSPLLCRSPGAAAFASYVASKAKTLLGKITVETSEIHVGDPYYPKPVQAFPAANGEWTVKTWPATTAFIARAPGTADLTKLTWKGLSCHGRSYQGVADRVFDPDDVEAMEADGAVRGKHIVSESAHEMRGRVAILGFKGSKVVCVVYPSMLNNL